MAGDEAQLMRLAMTYALIDNNYNIDIPHLEAALAFWESSKDSAIYIFSRHAENPLHNKIIKSLTTGEKSLTDLHHAFGNNIAAGEMDDALAELVDLKLVECRQEKSSGPKPKTIYALRKNEFNEFA